MVEDFLLLVWLPHVASRALHRLGSIEVFQCTVIARLSELFNTHVLFAGLTPPVSASCATYIWSADVSTILESMFGHRLELVGHGKVVH